MKRALLLVVVTASGCVSHWSASPDPLPTAMREELTAAAPLGPTAAPVEDAKGRQFLFIGGFLNEAIPGYFTDNVAVVRDELGTSATTVFPSSAGSLEDDAKLVRDTVKALYEKDPRPVVLVGHSKGAVAAVLAVLENPGLVASGRVDRVVAIQGPFHGSPVATGVTQAAPIPFFHSHFQGLSAMTPGNTDACFARALAQPRSAEVEAWLRDRVFFVRSAEAPADVSPELMVTYGYLSKHGRTDGLVLEDDMKLDGLGRDLGVLKGDHAAFVVSGALSNSSAAERRAFTRAMLREVFEPPRG